VHRMSVRFASVGMTEGRLALRIYIAIWMGGDSKCMPELNREGRMGKSNRHSGSVKDYFNSSASSNCHYRSRRNRWFIGPFPFPTGYAERRASVTYALAAATASLGPNPEMS